MLRTKWNEIVGGRNGGSFSTGSRGRRGLVMIRSLPVGAGLSLLVGLGIMPVRSESSKVVQKVALGVEAGQPLLPAGAPGKTVVRIGLTGFERPDEAARAPVNVALVLDTSGSMEGEKLDRAKEATRHALGLLGKDDVVSIVTYSDAARVLVPATRLSERARILELVDGLEPGGGTALFAGVSKGAAELRKFLADGRVNRLILLSDGQANVGPSTPAELGALGTSLVKEGISVTTLGLGLGYNEDLMTQLAVKSDGNHGFVETPETLTKFFDYEFGDVLAVVAQEVTVRVEFPEGVRPVGHLGRDVEFDANSAFALINQLYSGHEKTLLLEVEVPARPEGSTLELARVQTTYMNMATGATDRLEGSCTVTFSGSAPEVARATNKKVMVDVVKQKATLANSAAVLLRDEGKLVEARQVLEENAVYLESAAGAYEAPELEAMRQTQMDDARNLESDSWGSQRKLMLKNQQRDSYDARW